MIFGNIEEIAKFHEDIFTPRLKQAIHEPEEIAKLFNDERRKNEMTMKYGKYCINKPRSEYIVNQHKLGYITAIQRHNRFKYVFSF